MNTSFVGPSLVLFAFFMIGQELSTMMNLRRPPSMGVLLQNQAPAPNSTSSREEPTPQSTVHNVELTGAPLPAMLNPARDTVLSRDTIQAGIQVNTSKQDQNRSSTGIEFPTSGMTLAGGWARQKVVIADPRSTTLLAHLSVLSARIGSSKNDDGDALSWDYISVFAVVGSHDRIGGGCLEWDFESPVSLELTLDIQRSVKLAGSWTGVRRQLTWATKHGASPERQLCFGFVDVALPAHDQELRRALYEQHVQAQLVHHLPGLPSNILKRRKALLEAKMKKRDKKAKHTTTTTAASSAEADEDPNASSPHVTNNNNGLPQISTLTFLLEARGAIHRPKISLCLDALFGDVEHAALEFLSFYKLLGVGRVFVFDDSGGQRLKTALTSLNETPYLKGAAPTTKKNQNRNPSVPPPFVHFHSSGLGQFSFGSPRERAEIGYGARELTMAYCAMESSVDPLLLAPATSQLNSSSSQLDPAAVVEANDDPWLFVDIGLDEFLDCESMAKRSKQGRVVGRAPNVDIGTIVDKFLELDARCGKQCMELCLMRYKFGSILPAGTKTSSGYRLGDLGSKVSSLQATTASSLVAEEERGTQPSLLLQRYSRSQIGHVQGKCVIRPAAVLNMNLPIEVHGTLRQPNSKSCETTYRRGDGAARNNNLTKVVPSEELHCHYGAQFGHQSGFQRNQRAGGGNNVVCRLNHYRPEFYTKCPNGAAVCDTYNGQRSVYVVPSMVEATISWAAQGVRDSVAAAVAAAGGVVR